MLDLSLRADPEVWSAVPYPDDALVWRDACVANAFGDRQDDVLEAATLALRTRAELDATHVLFLDAVGHRLLGAVAVFAYDDVPAASDQSQAESAARAMVPSAWDVHSIVADAGAMHGWRVTIVDTASTDDSRGSGTGVVIDAIWTVYVLDAGGRCVVVLISPMSPPNAALAQMYTERLLETMEVVSK